MATSPLADARFLITRALGLARRGWVSLHTRGWRGSWARLRMQLQPRTARDRANLYLPAATMFVSALEKRPKFGGVRLVSAASAGIGTARDRLTVTARFVP